MTPNVVSLVSVEPNTFVKLAVAECERLSRDDRRRIRHLVRVAPPEAHRERLPLRLEVVAEEQLRVVADAHVHAAEGLVVVLVDSGTFWT